MNSYILLTGGAGFIGSNFVHSWIARRATPVINLDLLTYAGNLQNLATLRSDSRHIFVHADINDATCIQQALSQYEPCAVIHFAAESHVDRSIVGPADFINTNINGTFQLLEQVRAYWTALLEPERSRFRFIHISTDEVYGSLDFDAPPFSEASCYAPNSPYAASKAASDHLVRAYHHTYGLPAIITNCSNNYGPYQFPEKLIPLMILNAIRGKPLPIYGDGLNVRDWLYVGDHCDAICAVLDNGQAGETYNIGGWSERTNLDVVQTLCALLDELHPISPVMPHARLITFVSDRPGHDRRYAINANKLKTHLGWEPKETFETGLRKTVMWYLDHMEWLQQVTSGAYRTWIEANYANRGAECEA